ncbi:SagB/ThcOx family dehydrogenase [Streptomyces sp. NPDC088354]|uniref:SagB/ThcOx family dehydrogenase n=1 Tax=Streptomyces sp. NPDC088354 TaxID=3365856 RepID=UPI0038139666
MRGTAIQRFLAALGERNEVDTDTPAAPAFKQYANTTRVALGELAGTPGPLLRRLLGVTRVGWDQTIRPGTSVVSGCRPVPSGGARYPIEAYLADGSGLHHYHPAHHALEQVRAGDYRQALSSDRPDLVIILTCVFWRTGIRYGEFAYKLQCQETGALAAQFLTLAEEQGAFGKVIQHFDGPAATRLLGLDADAEGVMTLLSLHGMTHSGEASHPAPKHPPNLAGEGLTAAEALPAINRTLPHLLALHTAPRLGTGGPPPAIPPPSGPSLSLPPPAPIQLHRGINRRASTPAGFAPVPIEARQCAGLLHAAERGYSSALPGTSSGLITCALYVVVLRVAGLGRGGYRYHQGRLTRCPGDAAPLPAPGPLDAAALALGEAAIVVVPAGHPFAGVEQYGDAWYRIQQIEAGIVTQHAALAAAALGLTSRIHSDFCHPRTDTALGLPDPSWRGLSALFIGAVPERRSPTRWTSRCNEHE